MGLSEDLLPVNVSLKNNKLAEGAETVDKDPDPLKNSALSILPMLMRARHFEDFKLKRSKEDYLGDFVYYLLSVGH